MNDGFFSGIAGFLLGVLLVSILAGKTIGKNIEEINQLKQEAIDNGYAEYNNKTGEWNWLLKEE